PSTTSASRPASRAQPEMNRAISISPAPPGTNVGLTESIVTSRDVSWAMSSRTARCCTYAATTSNDRLTRRHLLAGASGLLLTGVGARNVLGHLEAADALAAADGSVQRFGSLPYP